MRVDNKFYKLDMESTREQFIRIAMAILKDEYRFRPQRLAIASKMYNRWRERNKMMIDIRSDKSLYVTIGRYTYYIDDSTNEQIIDKFKNK
tara:strand:+ start:3865 stop:4137 length:273 start_codon:yes stop_codon:yes gene_type:complete